MSIQYEFYRNPDSQGTKKNMPTGKVHGLSHPPQSGICTGQWILYKCDRKIKVWQEICHTFILIM